MCDIHAIIIVCVSMTSPCSLNCTTTFYEIGKMRDKLWKCYVLLSMAHVLLAMAQVASQLCPIQMVY